MSHNKSEKRIIIWGAGKLGREAHDFYGHDRIVYFVDNNKRKIGNKYLEIEIISFKYMCEKVNAGQYSIVIAVQDNKSIIEQLQYKGILDYVIYPSEREMLQDSNEYKAFLYMPTQITQINGMFFIVDCGHHRVLYSEDINRPIIDWGVMDDNLSFPHSIASDEKLYIVDNTELGEVCVYRKEGDKFCKTQTIYGLGFRPHKCVYDRKRQRFLVLLSASCEIAVLVRDGWNIIVQQVVQVDVEICYSRSIKIIDDLLYMISANGMIYEIDLNSPYFMVKQRYQVSENYYALKDIEKIGNRFYITTSNGIIRTDRLDNVGNAQDVTLWMEVKGSPYSLEKIYDRVFLTELYEPSVIASYNLGGGK